MKKFINLEISSNNLSITNEDNDNEDEIINNVINRINVSKYDFIDKILNEMIDNSVFNIKEVSKSNLERIELKFLNNIYEKFDIKKDIISKEIDLVYTYINYNDKNYLEARDNFNMKEIDNKLLLNFKEERREICYDIFFNIELTKKNLPFIRNVYIITPTPEIFEDFKKYIIIPIEYICEKEKFSKVYFRTNRIIKYLTEIKSLSRVFLYGSSEMIIVKNMSRNLFFKDNLPLINLVKKNFIKDEINIEEYNANILFQNKFDILFKLCNNNQLNLVRKDVINLTKKIFVNDLNVDFLLLQYFVGYYFYLYETKINNKNSTNGFYSNIQKYLLDRLNLIKSRKIDFFNLNYINQGIVPYYIHSFLYNFGIIENKFVKNIYFLFEIENSKVKYIIPMIEREIRENVENINFYIINKVDNINNKFGESLYLSFNYPLEKIKNVGDIILDIKDKVSLSEILYFINYVDSNIIFGERLNVLYPEKIMKDLEDKLSLPLTKILKINKRESNVKLGNITFLIKDDKN